MYAQGLQKTSPIPRGLRLQHGLGGHNFAFPPKDFPDPEGIKTWITFFFFPIFNLSPKDFPDPEGIKTDPPLRGFDREGIQTPKDFPDPEGIKT